MGWLNLPHSPELQILKTFNLLLDELSEFERITPEKMLKISY